MKATPGHPAARLRDMALPLALGVLAPALVLLGNAEYGPGAFPDSVVYLRQMAQLKAGALHPDYTPPGFAVLCHVVRSATGMSPIASAGLVTVAAFGLTVFIALFWLRLLGVSNLVGLWFGVTAAVSPLAAFAGDVMTESLFIFFITATLFSLDRVLAGNMRFLTLACLAAAGACLTRLVGVAAIAAGALLVLAAGGGSLAKRARVATIFVAAAGAPVAVWGITVFDPGFHRQGSFDIVSMVGSAAGTFVEWTFGREAARGHSALTRWIDYESPWLASAAQLGVLLVFLATLALPALWIRMRHGSSPRGGWKGWKGGWVANTLFLAIYAATLGAMSWFAGIGPPPRYWLPLYMPGLFVLALVLQTLIAHVSHTVHGLLPPWRTMPRRDLGLPLIAAAAALIVLITWQCMRLPALVAKKHEYIKSSLAVGRLLSSKTWEESKTMAHVKTLRPSAKVWTNQWSAVVWHVDPLFNRLRVRHWPDSEVGSDQSHLLVEAGSRVKYLVWFHHIPGRVAWPWYRWGGFCELQQHQESLIEAGALLTVAAFKDGLVFRVRPSPVSPQARALAADAVRKAALKGLVGPTSETIYESPAVDVYLTDDRVIYHVEDCTCGDLRFFLTVTPRDPADLPAWRRDYKTENFHHLFHESRRYVRSACAVVMPLPRYPLRSLRTGNWIRNRDGGWVADEWSVSVQFPR